MYTNIKTNIVKPADKIHLLPIIGGYQLIIKITMKKNCVKSLHWNGLDIEER